VVLSGALDDGTSGLAAIKAAGGLTVVQDPDEAAFPGMPTSAAAYVTPRHVVPLAEIPGILVQFAEEVVTLPLEDPPEGESMLDESRDQGPSEFTCPECGGTLWLSDGEPMRFRCRVGHSFSSESLLLGKDSAVENAVWAAIVALEERADLSQRLLRRAAGKTKERMARRYEMEIRRCQQGAATLRRLASDVIGPEAHEKATSGDD
jgi:two-component system chemotaxis response regulator CheB